MTRFENWNEITATESSNVKLPAGTYKCRIVGAQQQVSKKNNEMLVLALDIIEGEFKDYFMNKWKEKKDATTDGSTPKYPCLMYNLWTPERAGQCKWMIDLLEKNNNFKWDFNEASLAGKIIGVTFRDEEFLTQDGQLRMTAKPYRLVALDKIADAKVPEPKKLDMSKATSGFNSFAAPGANPIDEDVPF